MKRPKDPVILWSWIAAMLLIVFLLATMLSLPGCAAPYVAPDIPDPPHKPVVVSRWGSDWNKTQRVYYRQVIAALAGVRQEHGYD